MKDTNAVLYTALSTDFQFKSSVVMEAVFRSFLELL